MSIINTTDPHVNADDPLDIRHRRPQATGETVAEQANSAIIEANRLAARFFEDASKPEVRKRFSDEGHADELRKYEAALAADVDARIAQHEQHVAQLAQEVEREKAALTPALDVGGELRIDREWKKHETSFAKHAGGKLAYQVQEAITNAQTPEERNALLQMAPSYLEARGVPSGFIDKAVKQVAPAVAAKQAALRDAQREQLILRSNRATLGRALAEHRTAHPKTLVDINAAYSDRSRSH
jgi:hypothetical protein